MKKQMIREEQKIVPPKKLEPERDGPVVDEPAAHDHDAVASLHHSIGNQAVQRLIAQREGSEPTALDEETAGRINQARGGGQALDASVQAQMGQAMGTDLSGVRVHTSPESDSLNRQIGAKAFTTGQDVFFREGAYAPHTTDGQKLIAHEMTHVLQQGSGAVHGPGAGLTVNAPGDAFEQEADSAADAVMNASSPSASLQKQAEEEEEPIQAQAEEEEVQMQEEEEEVQMQEEEEEIAQAQAALQRQEMPEEELV